MSEIQLFLAPAPGAKPEFLANVKPVDPSPAAAQLWKDLCSHCKMSSLVLENYTREGWSWKPLPQHFQTLTILSVDGRNKLPGFIKYLKGRQKSAYGRISGCTYLMVVSYVQAGKSDDPNRIECRICKDMTAIPNCSIKPKIAAAQPAGGAKPPPSAAAAAAAAPAKKGGFLGKLVGAQQRTNMHVAVSNAKTQPRVRPQQQQQQQQPPPNQTGESDAFEAPLPVAEPTATKTAQEVFAEFRQICQDKMLDFDMSDDEVLKVPISLKEQTALLAVEEKPKVTMEILKYMVYEAAEEVNEEWVAHKEPSEFMDEAIIAVYKEGAAPMDVLEELNRGELPDEVLGQQKAMAAAQQRQADAANLRAKKLAEEEAHRQKAAYQDEDAEEISALNTQKRDRRSLEEFQREKTKRSRTS